MDVLLETIENLKVLKKNHEEDPENYGFDYWNKPSLYQAH